MKIIIIVAISFGALVQQISALLAIPTEELLGPEVCPTGSFCTETNQCTETYYTTKSGNPFYCGPLHNIDSKICCIDTEATLTPNASDKNELQLDSNKTTVEHRFSILNNSNSIEDDDEVDILSLPFSTNHIEEFPFDPESTLVNPDAELERPIGDIESMLEDAIEQELNSATSGKSANARETGFRTVDAQQFQQPHLDQFNAVHEPAHSQDLPLENAIKHTNFAGSKQNFEHTPSDDVEFRTFQNHESQTQQRAFTCPCERGEKGEPGPKGEPGEPGKIIYIPVFVNTAPTGTPAGVNYGVSPGAPVQFSSNQQSWNQPAQGQIPQHPNPTVVPFNVPINVPASSNPSALHTTGILTPTPQQHSLPLSHQTSQQQVSVSQAYQQQQQSPPFPTLNPSSNPQYSEDLQARLSRNTHINDQRYANTNRRY